MKTLPAGLMLATLLSATVHAENWGQWRGPFFNGSTTETGLPSTWDKTNNVAWVAPLPGYSSATPAVWGDSVFVSSPDARKNLNLLCLDRKTGAVRWQKQVATGDRDRGRNNMASPSPVTDGKRVFVMFGTGDLAAYDFEGKELWQTNLTAGEGKFSINWLYGSSPMLYDNKLFVQVLQRTPVPEDYSAALDGKADRESYLLCLDPATGKTLWRHARATDALEEAQEAYSTPTPSKTRAGEEIIIVGADYATAHSAKTGEELWRCAGLNPRKERPWRLVPTPVVADGVVVACGPRRDPVLGIRDGGAGNVTETNILWRFKEAPSDCVTPLFYQNKLFVLDGDRQVMTCLDPKTGAKRWQGNLGVKEIFRGSPSGADGKIYCISETGTAVVLDAGAEFKVLATVRMGESPVRSSIAIAHGQLFIRTAKNLYCIGKP
jgi:outer membrane protein assembly factor BamB